jgi:AraC-like DNA-binding protein/ligand-binding sensor protein
MNTRPGIPSPTPHFGPIADIIRWAEQHSPLRLNFDDLGGIQRDVPALAVDDEHEIHACQFCLFAKKTPRGLEDCRRNKRAVNRLVLRGRKGVAGHCHLGLFDMAEPLMLDRRVLGVFYFGSVLVKGEESKSRERVLRYCARRKIEATPYLQLLKTMPRIAKESVPGHREFLRSVAALGAQCCRATGLRVEDYKPMPLGIRYRPHDEMPYLVKAAIRYAHEHLRDRFTVKEMAAHIRCHPNFLSKQFKKYMQIELATYAAELRIAQAIRLMANPRLSLGQVADESGFPDRVYFGKAFRRATGLTPGEYRARLAS